MQVPVASLVALAGIVVNNAIVLIDTYNRFRRDGTDVIEAVLKTAAQRIRPILLTTITTIAGLVPMATQINLNFIDRVVSIGGITSIWWVQLSTAVISGLAFSTLLTLVVVPVLLAAPAVWKPYFVALATRTRGLIARGAAMSPVGQGLAPIPARAGERLPDGISESDREVLPVREAAE